MDQSGVSTAISTARTHLVHLFITSAVKVHINSNQNVKRKNFWTMQPCRPGRYINCMISQAKAYLAQLHITRAVYLLDDTAVPTGAVYQPRSAKQKHTRRSCISTAWYINRDQKREITSGATVYQQRATSTAISTAEAYLAQLYINSHQKLKAKPFWTTQPCRSQRYIKRDQLQEKYLAQMFVTSTV